MALHKLMLWQRDERQQSNSKLDVKPGIIKEILPKMFYITSNSFSMSPEEKNFSKRSKERNWPTPEKNKKSLSGFLKSIGFKLWLGVMIIGGTLAFLVALFLV